MNIIHFIFIIFKMWLDESLTGKKKWEKKSQKYVEMKTAWS